MASQAQVTWVNPTQRTDNTALALGFTRFQLQSPGSSAFVQLVDVPAPTQTTTVTTPLNPGNYVLRATWYDTQSPAKASTSVDYPFTVAAVSLAAPKPGTISSVVVS